MLRLFTILSLFAFYSCSADESPEKPVNSFNSPSDLKKEVVVSGLNQAWGIAFLDNEQALVTQKGGQILLVNVETGNKQNLFTVPNATVHGQGGLLGIALSPDFDNNNKVFVTYTKQGAQGLTTALGSFTYANESISGFQEIYVANAFTSTGVHFGSRIVFDNEGYLYFSIGDRGQMNEAQNTQNEQGCVLRLNQDGTIPTDNPYASNSELSPAIYSYGNRNIQGMVFNTLTNQIWANEHGPQGGDEINIITAGSNYGWPLATFGEQYGGGEISPNTSIPGAVDPIHHWTPSIAPAGMTIITGDKYPGWEGNVFSGALALQHLNRTVFNNGVFVEELRYFEGQGRIRDVVLSPDGYLYMINETTNEIIKVLPVSE
jgi:glucose/arabinose dehydrogenase